MSDYRFMYVYITTNIKNGKRYIGIHKTNNINDGYIGSGRIFKRAIKKHGKHQFKKQIIEFCLNETTLKKREVFWIYKYDAKKSREFYNFSDGGESKSGCPVGKSIRIKISKTLKKFYKDNPHLIPMHSKGKKISKKVIDKRTKTRALKKSNWKKIVVIGSGSMIEYFNSKNEAINKYGKTLSAISLKGGCRFYKRRLFAIVDKNTNISELIKEQEKYTGISRTRSILVENIKTKEIKSYPTIIDFCNETGFSYPSVTSAIYRNKIYKKIYKIA